MFLENCFSARIHLGGLPVKRLLLASALSLVALAARAQQTTVIQPSGGSASGCTVSGTTNGVVTYNGSSGCNVSALQTMTTAAASTPATFDVGSIFTGGSGTTTFPHYFFQPTGTTAASTWSTAGTLWGGNLPTGYTGNILDVTINGSSTHAAIITGAGALTLASTTKTTSLQITSAGANVGSMTSSAAGHMRVPANGSAPAISACGGSPAIDANANDASGTVTFGSAATTCTITFNIAYTTFAHCLVTFQSSLAAEAYSYTRTAITITATALSGNADYRCDGT